MSQFPQIVVKHNIGNTIEIPNQLDIRTATYLSDNVAAGVSSLPVDNAIDFTSGCLLLLSSLGAENAEMVNSTSHTNTTFTVGTTSMPHNRGDSIQEIKYDQVNIFKSPTINGVYVLLTGPLLKVTQQNTIMYDFVGLTTDFYKVQWRNSITAAVSPQSDPISILTYPENSVANIIYPVLRAMGVNENDPKINTTFCLSAVNDARLFTQGKLYGIRHSWQEEFEHPIKMLAGNNYVYLPDDIDFKETDMSLLAARFLIGNVLTPYNMRYIDKRLWNQVSFSVQGSNTATDTAIAAVTINLDNVGDFPPTGGGVAFVATTDFNQTTLQISYTGVNVLTNQLTGVTGVTRAFPAGTRVWSNPSIGQPVYYTVYDNKIVFERIIPDSLQGNNVYIDYYKKIDLIEDLYQEIPEHYRELYKWYFRYAIKYRKDNDTSSDDPDLKKFEELVGALYNNLYTGQETTIITQ